jgi:hypothetical protein
MPEQESNSLLTPRKLITQLIGFALGAALLVWCISKAIKGGGAGWEKLQHANPLLIAGLVSCTLVSLLVNGAIFWIVVRPVHPVRLDHMQYLNLVTSVLNYAPIRAGLIARIAYNLRVDRMSLLLIGGWFAAIGYTLVLTLGAVVMTTVIRGLWGDGTPRFDGMWFFLLAVQLVVGGVLTRMVVGMPLVQRGGKGMDRMLRQPSALWGAIILRLVDVAAYAGRMGCAAAILGLNLSVTQVILLAIAAIAVSLNPLGRVGYREVGVAFFASYLGMSGETFDAARNQLALIESAGEAVVAIPLGALSLLWYRHQWMHARRTPPVELSTTSAPNPARQRQS